MVPGTLPWTRPASSESSRPRLGSTIRTCEGQRQRRPLDHARCRCACPRLANPFSPYSIQKRPKPQICPKFVPAIVFGSEFFGPHRVPGRELTKFLSAFYLRDKANSLSFLLAVICVTKRTCRVVFSQLFAWQSELTEFFFRRAHRVCPKTQWGSVNSLPARFLKWAQPRRWSSSSLIFFSLLVWKMTRARKTIKETRIVLPKRNPKMSGDEGKTREKTRNSMQKKKARNSKKNRKGKGSSEPFTRKGKGNSGPFTRL